MRDTMNEHLANAAIVTAIGVAGIALLGSLASVLAIGGLLAVAAEATIDWAATLKPRS